jgi:hypothetical protein
MVLQKILGMLSFLASPYGVQRSSSIRFNVECSRWQIYDQSRRLVCCLGQLPWLQVIFCSLHIVVTEQFQAIILSHKELPLSLFYNTGPRFYSKAHHHNRWLPTKVSKDALSSDTTVELQIWNSRHCTSLLMLRNPKGPLSSSNTPICLVWQAVSNTQPFQIVIGHDRVYRIKPVIEPFDSFNVTAFSYTCFIFENLKRGAHESARGACFYFNGREGQEKISAGRADLELVFCYPLRIFREIFFQHTQLGAMYKAFETHPDCKVHIKFGKHFCPDNPSLESSNKFRSASDFLLNSKSREPHRANLYASSHRIDLLCCGTLNLSCW